MDWVGWFFAGLITGIALALLSLQVKGKKVEENKDDSV